MKGEVAKTWFKQLPQSTSVKTNKKYDLDQNTHLDSILLNVSNIY